MISFHRQKWLTLFFLLTLSVSNADLVTKRASSQSENVLVPEVAPKENHIILGRNPKPNYLSSPAKLRLAAKQEKKHKWTQDHHPGSHRHKHPHHKDSHHSHHASHHRKHSRCQDQVCDIGVNTIYSGVYPTLNLTWVSPKGSKQSFVSFIDTGSSDTWVVTSDFECIDIDTLAPLDQNACQFGKLFKNDGGFHNITDQEFDIEYFPELERLYGSMGYHSLELAGISIPKTQVALVDKTAWLGDGTSSGLLGLSYPSITSSTYRSNGSAAIYSPVFYTMIKEHLTKPIFSLSLDRVPVGTTPSAEAGVMAVGGLVPEHLFKRPFTTVPIEGFQEEELTEYVITHEFIYGKTAHSKHNSTGSFQSIVDSGTAPNFMPTDAVNELNALFDPPAVYNSTLGYFTVDCNAKAPYAAFVINGTVMPMDPRDMIVRSLNGIEGYEKVCFSSFAQGGTANVDEMIIGEVWQRSYVVAYDIGNVKMHFAPRQPY